MVTVILFVDNVFVIQDGIYYTYIHNVVINYYCLGLAILVSVTATMLVYQHMDVRKCAVYIESNEC